MAPSSRLQVDGRPDENRWEVDQPPEEPRTFPDVGCAWGPYEPEETMTNEYEIWDYRDAGYMNPGTYRWEERIRIFTPNEGAHWDGQQLGSFHWGFELNLSVPEDV